MSKARLSAPALTILLVVIATTALADRCENRCVIVAGQPYCGRPIGDSLMPVSWPGNGGSPADYTAIENLPSPQFVQRNVYTATFDVCEGGDANPGGCTIFFYHYFDNPFPMAQPGGDPCCMGAYIADSAWQVAVTNGDCYPPPYQPEPYVYGTLHALSAIVGDYGIDDAATCYSYWNAASQYAVQRIGCQNRNAGITIDGAHMVDHVTLASDDPSELSPLSGFTQDIDHKFY